MQTVAAASSAGRYSSSEASGSAGGRRGTARGKVREGLGGFEQNQRRRTSLLAQTHHHQTWFGSCQQQSKRHGGVVEAVIGGHHLRAGRPEHPSHESAASLPSVATSAAPSATGCAEPAQAYRSQPWWRQPRRAGAGLGQGASPPRELAGAPEPRERGQHPQGRDLRHALRPRVAQNQPAQAYRSQPWRRQSRRAGVGLRTGGKAASGADRAEAHQPAQR